MCYRRVTGEKRLTKTDKALHEYLSKIGTKGGKVKSKKKALAAAANSKKKRPGLTKLWEERRKKKQRKLSDT